MSPKQSIQYVNTLNTLFVNKVITVTELRAALSSTPFFETVCQPRRHLNKGKRKRSSIRIV